MFFVVHVCGLWFTFRCCSKAKGWVCFAFLKKKKKSSAFWIIKLSVCILHSCLTSSLKTRDVFLEPVQSDLWISCRYLSLPCTVAYWVTLDTCLQLHWQCWNLGNLWYFFLCSLYYCYSSISLFCILLVICYLVWLK